ncbi:MAG: hypothetical protein FWD48_05925 [Oscillospiraceae bacterium]|nr:hypothetical protein [Oscillospiraceae bacterium]
MNRENLTEKLEEFESEILDIIRQQLMPSVINASSAAALQRNLSDNSSQQYQEFHNSLNVSLNRLYDSFDLGKMSKNSSLYYADEIKEYLEIFYNVLEISQETTIDAIVKELSTGSSSNKILERTTDIIKDRNRILGNYLYENSRLFGDYMLLWEGEGDRNKYYRFTSENMNACPTCCDLDKSVFRICDASIGVNMPPIHPNCLCFIDVLEESDNPSGNEQESHSPNLFDITNIVLNTPSIIDWRKYMPANVKPPDTPSSVPTIDINAEIIALITSEEPDSSGKYPSIADMDDIWYEDPFNWIEEHQCPWFVLGRIGEIYGVQVTFDGSGNGGLWAQNAEEKAYIWKDGEKTDEYRTVHRELSWENIVPQSAVSFGNPAPWGHVVFIEAIEVINGEKWIYYSDDWKNGGNRGKVSKKLLSDFIGLCPEEGTIKGHPTHGEFRGYVQII